MEKFCGSHVFDGFSIWLFISLCEAMDLGGARASVCSFIFCLDDVAEAPHCEGNLRSGEKYGWILGVLGRLLPITCNLCKL